jgi:hypothetical protein
VNAASTIASGPGGSWIKLSKQADVLMLFYLFSTEELGVLCARLGYPFEYETIPRNVASYDACSSHGSTLSSQEPFDRQPADHSDDEPLGEGTAWLF